MKTSDQPRKAIVKRNKFFFSRFFQHFLETTLPTFITGSYFLLSPRRAPGPAYCFFVSLVVRALGILCMDDPIQPVEKGVIDRVSRHGEAYRGEGGFAILRDDEDDLNDQDGSSGRNKHEQGANSARHGLLRGAGADELAHQQR